MVMSRIFFHPHFRNIRNHGGLNFIFQTVGSFIVQRIIRPVTKKRADKIIKNNFFSVVFSVIRNNLEGFQVQSEGDRISFLWSVSDDKITWASAFIIHGVKRGDGVAPHPGNNFFHIGTFFEEMEKLVYAPNGICTEGGCGVRKKRDAAHTKDLGN